MTALLELPAIRERVARLSVEEYHRLGELPIELLRGTIIEKVSKSPIHYTTLEDLRQILSGQIPPGYLLRQEGPLTFTDSEPEPDLCVVRGEKDSFRKVHPNTAELVVEIAVSSIEIDRVKAQIYAEAGVREYWIVCPEAKVIEVYRQPSPKDYLQRATVSAPTVLESVALPGVRVDIAALFA
jgi:Uma2 family endonuclease